MLPGVFRSNYDGYAEQCLYYEFQASAGLLLGSNLGHWEVAFLMQHHGLPTRFLDWTETFATALYFAMKNHHENAAVWMLDPYRLNAQTFGQDEVLDIDADFPHNYYEYFIADKKAAFPGDVAAVLPKRSNLRLASQRGLFTLHSSCEPLESKYAGCLCKFELRADAAAAAMKYLRLAGADEYSLFPDLDGLCRQLRGRYEYLSATRCRSREAGAS